MKTNHINILFIAIAFCFLTACDSPDAFDCFKKSGDTTQKVESIANTQFITVYDDLNIELEYGPQKEITVSGGENLIESVSLDFRGDSLIIRNNNKCRWVRPYGNITLRITTDDLTELENRGYGWIKSVNTLEFEALTIESKDSPGDVDLVVDTEWLHFINNYIANYSISGKTDFLWVEYYYNDGKFLGENLETSDVYVVHVGENDVNIKVEEFLEAHILGNGNIRYKGSPAIDLQKSGTGELVKLD